MIENRKQKTEDRRQKTGTEIALRMREISKRFGPVQALCEVSITIRRGTVHALVGENGAGKSTLMKILAGVYQPDGGSIEINGKPQIFSKPGEALSAGISMIYQELDLAEHLTVAENVFLGMEPAFGGLPFIIDHKKMIAQTTKLAQNFNFKIDPMAVVEDLPMGACQIVEILKALMRNASIIVMDEPTSALSESEAAMLFEAVRALREQRLSIIYISHRLEEIVGLADDVSVLRDGRMVHTGPMSELDIPKIVHYMVGRELKDFFPTGVPRASCPGIRVRVRNLSSENAVEDISFDIRAGEIVGMAGLVGAGRTQVARALFGIDRKTSGTIELDGRKLQINSPTDAIANDIAFLTEDRKRTGLCLELPCSWNVTLPLLSQGLPPRRRGLVAIGMKNIIKPGRENKIVTNIASRLSIKWSGPQAPAASLSGGNQQKILIARWLLAQSKFMIFDEPTRGIDVGAKREIYSVLRELAAEGKAILFISSELPELLGICERILVLRRGRLVADVNPKKTTAEQVMHLAAVEAAG